jgi:hypothetical protein
MDAVRARQSHPHRFAVDRSPPTLISTALKRCDSLTRRTRRRPARVRARACRSRALPEGPASCATARTRSALIGSKRYAVTVSNGSSRTRSGTRPARWSAQWAARSATRSRATSGFEVGGAERGLTPSASRKVFRNRTCNQFIRLSVKLDKSSRIPAGNGPFAVLRHLADVGHRDVVHIAGPHDWVGARNRVREYEA